MAPNKQRPNSGILSKNDYKKNDSHPDYRGTIDVNGTEFDISAWIKQGRNGKFMSLAVKPKGPPKSPAGQWEQERAQDAQQAKDILDDDDPIPF